MKKLQMTVIVILAALAGYAKAESLGDVGLNEAGEPVIFIEDWQPLRIGMVNPRDETREWGIGTRDSQETYGWVPRKNPVCRASAAPAEAPHQQLQVQGAPYSKALCNT